MQDRILEVSLVTHNLIPTDGRESAVARKSPGGSRPSTGPGIREL